jgi:hypothetical protein
VPSPDLLSRRRRPDALTSGHRHSRALVAAVPELRPPPPNSQDPPAAAPIFRVVVAATFSALHMGQKGARRGRRSRPQSRFLATATTELAPWPTELERQAAFDQPTAATELAPWPPEWVLGQRAVRCSGWSSFPRHAPAPRHASGGLMRFRQRRTCRCMTGGVQGEQVHTQISTAG